MHVRWEKAYIVLETGFVFLLLAEVRFIFNAWYLAL